MDIIINELTLLIINVNFDLVLFYNYSHNFINNVNKEKLFVNVWKNLFLKY